MGKRDQPYNIIKEAVLKVQSDIVEIKSDIDEIKRKPQSKGKKIWVIFSIAGTLIIFVSSLIQNLLVTNLDSEISQLVGTDNEFRLAQLKKQKLRMRDQISMLEMEMFPDQPA